MGLRLTVAESPTLLVEALADVLARPTADPFAAEVVAVPADGVRSWVLHTLSERLGATGHGHPDGVAANIEVVFPATLIRRALGHDAVAPGWQIGALTWTIHAVLSEWVGHEPAQQVVFAAPDDGIDLLRCRAIADLFDRYAVHRAPMVRAWERGLDVDVTGRALPESLRWQPTLWRAVVGRLGSPGAPGALALATAELRAGRRIPDLPERVSLLGVAGLPAPHLEVLVALSTQLRVEMFVPTPSVVTWQRLSDQHGVSVTEVVPRPRTRSSRAPAHPLVESWGRIVAEAHLLLGTAARQAGAEVELVHEVAPDGVASAVVGPATMLAQLQADIRQDRPPAGPAPDASDDRRVALVAGDRSIVWHRCHGAARQVEVLRDEIVRLLEACEPDGRPRYQPHDIAVLCGDVATFAPLIEAAFAGDPASGAPGLPVRVADRSLRDDQPLLDALAALVDLVGGRVRASELLGFLARSPVRTRFGLDHDDLGQLAQWVEQTNVRWGLDPSDQARAGLPGSLGAHSWRDGLDQLLVGAAMADADFRADELTAPAPDPDDLDRVHPAEGIEGDVLELAGALAEACAVLGEWRQALAATCPPAEWFQTLRGAATALFSVPDAFAWQWRIVDQLLDAMITEATSAAVPAEHLADPTELAALVRVRIAAPPARTRFGTGAITVSGLTARRGVPHRVVCLLGIHDEMAAGSLRGDDLMALTPCIGDRDSRSELRAQLLDALLAAGDRLVICSDGHDVRTNAPVAPPVVLAELADVLDATFRPTPDGQSASAVIAVDHPRHRWSDDNFLDGALGVDGPWSFDVGGLTAARARRSVEPTRSRSVMLPPAPSGVVDLADVEAAVTNPVRTLLRDRLGARVADSDSPVDDLIPLTVAGLPAWRLRDQLLQARLAPAGGPDAERVERWARSCVRRGAVPPGLLGRRALASISNEVTTMLERLGAACGPLADVVPTEREIELTLADGRRLVGRIGGVREHLLVVVSAGRPKPERRWLTALRLAGLSLHDPDTSWRAVLVERKSANRPEVTHLALRSTDAALALVSVAVDLHDRARSSVLPVMPATAEQVHLRGLDAITTVWDGHEQRGDRFDRWVQLGLGDHESFELAAIPPEPDESGPAWGDADSRLVRWARRLWGTFDEAVDLTVPDDRPRAAGDADG